MSKTIAPRSDQMNADDFIAGPLTVTISEVREGAAERPVDIHLVEFPGRPYRPSKSMRRMIVAAWGGKTADYTGRQLTLYRNPATKFGAEVLGGIEISHASHINKRVTLNLTVRRGKREPFHIDPLPAQRPAPAGAAPNIPQEVIDTTAGIFDLATVAKYAEHLKSEGAPAHITDWVLAQRKER